MATVLNLVICFDCHCRLKNNEAFTKWEGRTYCDTCFEKFLDKIEPSEWKDSEKI